jgi:cytochrome c biogenesis protein CcdA
MDNVTLILSSLMGVALVILMAPNILRMNQGKILRNIALWMAIFLGLALVYQTFGPEKLGGQRLQPASQAERQDDRSDSATPAAEEPATDDAPQGYSPPNEN